MPQAVSEHQLYCAQGRTVQLRSSGHFTSHTGRRHLLYKTHQNVGKVAVATRDIQSAVCGQAGGLSSQRRAQQRNSPSSENCNRLPANPVYNTGRNTLISEGWTAFSPQHVESLMPCLVTRGRPSLRRTVRHQVAIQVDEIHIQHGAAVRRSPHQQQSDARERAHHRLLHPPDPVLPL